MYNQSEQESTSAFGCLAKTDVAKAYFPHLGERASLNALSKEIRDSKGLLEELETVTSYNKFKHHFTPRQIEIIVKYLGPPVIAFPI